MSRDILFRTKYRAPYRVSDAAVGRGIAGWITSKELDVPALAGTAHDGLPQTRLEETL